MIKAKKHFGQNFLKDKSVIKKIIQAIPKDTKNIVEIGPGLGDLTQELLELAPTKAYEIDADLIVFLQKKFQKELESKRLQLLHKDASDAFCLSLNDEAYFLVANLPYYVATHLILQAFEDDNCKGLIVMVQKEVAQKFCAKSGEKEYSALGILCELICERQILFEVEPECFEPAPKVISAVMKLEKKAKFTDFCEPKAFKDFLRICFSSPRKQLINNLKAHKDKLAKIFGEPDLNIRPHELCVNSYLKIYNEIKDEYERRK